MRKLSTFFALLLTITINAQINEILGDWLTFDDKTGDNFSVVNIYKAADGKYYGKIAKMLVGKPDERCIECTGDDYNKPLEGLVIIRAMSEKNGELTGGKVLDPESGKFYYGKIYIKNGNLVLRGSLDRAGILGRSQTWKRKK